MNDNPYLGKAEEILTALDRHPVGIGGMSAPLVLARAQVEATLAVADELRRIREAAYRSS